MEPTFFVYRSKGSFSHNGGNILLRLKEDDFGHIGGDIFSSIKTDVVLAIVHVNIRV